MTNMDKITIAEAKLADICPVCDCDNNDKNTITKKCLDKRLEILHNKADISWNEFVRYCRTGN